MTNARKMAAALATVVALATGCGGETVAVLGVIGAAGGDFVLDGNPDTAALERVPVDPNDPNGNALGINLVIDANPADPEGDPWENLYEPTYGVRTAAGGDLGDGGCSEVTGTVRGDRLDLGACFQGRFTSVNRVVSDDGEKVLLFGSFSPSLASGIWVDIDQPSRRIKFSDDTNGCEFVNGAATGRLASITLQGEDLENGLYDDVLGFELGDQIWTAGDFVGISGLRLSGTPGTLQLQRVRDTEPPTACP